MPCRGRLTLMIARIKACVVKNCCRTPKFSSIDAPQRPIITRWGIWHLTALYKPCGKRFSGELIVDIARGFQSAAEKGEEKAKCMETHTDRWKFSDIMLNTSAKLSSRISA